MTTFVEKEILDSAEIIKNSLSLSAGIQSAANEIINSLKNGNKVIIFGNGGSAADSQHIAAELVGRYLCERKSLPAIALSTDTSILTALGNDYSFDQIFSRQCEGLVCKNDVVIGISTSGNSKNVINGLKLSKEKKAKTIGLLGNGGGIISKFVDIPIIVESSSTPRIQEVHRVVYHIICDLVEQSLTKTKIK
ncbi:D-sedoheptulose-7-phosphate isomerase [Nitrosopumilus sp.]|uniref:D-sedoheptulose-7-phosphate isomerase n=1 Tax=Nitrosopumilus sp. TaxID=2024843 RepID=UPI003B5CAC49